MKYLLDVGGTHIDLYCIPSIGLLVKHIQRAYVSEIPCLDTFLQQTITSLSTHDDLVVGLPGDVSHARLQVFCPPLQQSISIDYQSENVKFVNDTQLHPYFFTSYMPTHGYDTLLLTVGTSIGLCIVKPSFFRLPNVSYTKSYEFAHLHPSSLPVNFPIPSKISPSEAHSKSVFSAGGFAASLGLPYKVRDDDLYITYPHSFNSLLSCSPLSRNTVCLTFDWLQALISSARSFALTEGHQTLEPMTLFSGGLASVVSQSSLKVHLNSLDLVFPDAPV